MNKLKKNVTPVTLCLLLTISGCAGNSNNTQAVVVTPAKLTPLSQSVLQIDPASSADYLRRASNFREKVKALSDGETTK